MSGPEPEPCFIDTNIWLYALIEDDDPGKSARAKLLIETRSAVIVSTQVINEVCVDLIKKAQLSEQHVQQLIELFYAKYLVVELSKPLLLKASALRKQYAFSFWDSLIVSSALSADAPALYSEDMQDGLVVGAGAPSEADGVAQPGGIDLATAAVGAKAQQRRAAEVPLLAGVAAGADRDV